MKNYFKKILILMLIVSFQFQSLQIAHALEQAQRNEVIKFLDSLVDIKMWQGSYKDLFRRYCQRQAIFSIRDQLSQMRRDLIEAIIEDLNVNVDEIINEYYQKNAELFFLRNFVASSQENYTLSDEEAKALETRKEALQSEMYKYFVIEKGYMSGSALEEYLDNFYARYNQKTFATCPEPTIEGVKIKLKSIVDKFEALKWENLEEDMELDEPINYKASTLKDGPNTKTFFGGHIGIKSNLIEPIKNAKEMYKSIRQTLNEFNTPNTSKDPTKTEQKTNEITLSNIQSSYENDEIRFDFELEAAKRLAKYEIKYSQTGDSITARLTDLLKTLDTTIKNSYPTIENVGKCISKTLDKQCSE